MGSEEWISVLKLSQKWQLHQIRTIALEHLPYPFVAKSPTEKVALAFQYDIKQWLLPGLNELAQRPEPINVEDVQILGLEVALKIAAIRESLVFEPSTNEVVQSGWGSLHSSSSPSGHVTSGTRNARDVDFTPTIKTVFESALEGFELSSGKKRGKGKPKK